MEVYFNDLSLVDKEIIEYDEIQAIRNIYKALKLHGINYCRIDNESFIKLHSIINCMPNNANFRYFFFAFFKDLMRMRLC